MLRKIFGFASKVPPKATWTRSHPMHLMSSDCSDFSDVAHVYIQVFRVSYHAEGPFGKSLCPAVVTGPICVQVQLLSISFYSLCYEFIRTFVGLTYYRRTIKAILREVTRHDLPPPPFSPPIDKASGRVNGKGRVGLLALRCRVFGSPVSQVAFSATVFC
jgi:hypothetical protein